VAIAELQIVESPTVAPFVVTPEPVLADTRFVESPANASFVISPELVLVDPELRAVALRELERSTFVSGERFGRALEEVPRASMSTLRGVAAPDAEDPSDTMAQATLSLRQAGGATDLLRRYALRVSLFVNLFLLGLFLASPPWSPLQSLISSGNGDQANLEGSPSRPPDQPAAVPAPRADSTATHMDSQLGVGGGGRVRQVGAPRAARPSAATHPRDVARAMSVQSLPTRLAEHALPTTRQPTTTSEAAEHRVLEFIRHSGALRQFIDPLTKLVKTNVVVRCTPTMGRLGVSRAGSFACVVWQHPRPMSTGVSVVYRARPGDRFSISGPVRRA
jgi:hypothetical protein